MIRRSVVPYFNGTAFDFALRSYPLWKTGNPEGKRRNGFGSTKLVAAL
jgi:hypothetical protein